ncbi:MAG: hypothetical protein A4E40_01383 [Methanoregulaceae archaeon PtaU1.Bin059]|nr:MAG: hypothetical protein A4E40_01383 [Methanoregulaceae archaeon PtaU1.Bin059]
MSVAPAPFDMLSSNIVPPRSSPPAIRHICAILSPSFTHETWICGILSRKRRETAVISRSSLPVAPARACPLRKSGVSRWMKLSGTNSVNPPVSSWISLMISRCRARSSTVSQWPYMMVAVDGIPREWASLIIRTHSAVDTLPGQITARTPSTRISAAVPQRDPRPASFIIPSISTVVMPLFLAP